MTNAKEVTKMALFISLAVLLGYVESLFPPPVAVPGIKLGLSNVIVLFALYEMGAKKAWIIALLKVFLCSLLFGTGISLLYSLSGSIMSLALMQTAKKTGLFSVIGTSSIGGIFHNMGQLLCAYFFVGKGAIIHIPVLCLSGAICGIFTGVCATIIIKRGSDIFGKR